MIAKACLRLAARVLETYLRATSKTLRLRIFLEDGAVLIPAGRSLNAIVPESSPTLLPFWNAHSLLLISSYLSSPQMVQVASRLEAVADDSPGGLLSEILFSHIGITTRRLRFRSIEDRLEDLQLLLKAKPSLLMAADSHGPYRSISPGMARLARNYMGSVKPISLTCDRSIPIFRRIRMAVPRRNATICLAIGRPLDERRSVGDTRVALDACLVKLESQSRILLQQGPTD